MNRELREPATSDGAAPERTERERNSLLRRADWRFLLADPSPALSVCLAGGRLAKAVAAISTAVADPARQPVGRCDLAVAVDPSTAALESSWRAVRPGGACYTEWYRPPASAPRAVAQRLRVAGFEDIRLYWAWPWPASGRTRVWLPLDTPSAIRFFVEERPPRRTAIGRLVHELARRLVSWALPRGLAYPVVAIARKPGGGVVARDDAGPRVEVGALQPEVDPRRSLSWLLLTGGPRSISKAVGLGFEGDEPHPRVAMKMARTLEGSNGILREAETLRALELTRPALRGVPRVLFLDKGQGSLRLVETAFTGALLYAHLRPDNFRDHAGAVTDWLLDLAGAPQPAPRDAWWDRIVEPALTSFESAFGDAIDSRLLAESRAIIEGLEFLPVVPEQRDLGPWNILLTDRGIAVLDWESGESAGLPALDLVYFLAHAAFFVEGAMRSGRNQSAYRTSRDPGTRTGAVSEACMERYRERVGLGRDAILPLRLLTWMIHAGSEHKRLVEDAGGVPPIDALRGALFTTLWREDLRAGR